MITKRKKLPVSLLLAIVACVLLMACTAGAKLPRLADDAIILAFGDSLTFGTGTQPMESYLAVLERQSRSAGGEFRGPGRGHGSRTISSTEGA